MDVLLGPAHLGDVDQAFDARLQLDEGAIFGDVGDAAREHAVDRIFGRGAFPRIALELLHAEADALGVAVDADDLHLDRVADVDHLARVADALVADVGDVEQAVDPAEVDERAVIGDVLDDAVDRPGPRPGVWIRPERCSARVSSRIARRETTMLPRRRSIFRIWNGCGRSISGPTSRTGRMSTWLPGRKATAPPRSTVKPPLTRPKITPSTRSPFVEFLLELVPGGFAAGAVAAAASLRRAAFSTRST